MAIGAFFTKKGQQPCKINVFFTKKWFSEVWSTVTITVSQLEIYFAAVFPFLMKKCAQPSKINEFLMKKWVSRSLTGQILPRSVVLVFVRFGACSTPLRCVRFCSEFH